MKAKLYIGGIKTPIGHESLRRVVSNLEDNENSTAIYKKLLGSNDWRIKDTIAARKYVDKDIVKTLLKEKRHGLITSILLNNNALKFLSTKDILKILKRDNPIHYEAVANNIEKLTKCNKAKIIKKIAKHKDPNVRANLLSRWKAKDWLPTKIAKRLKQDKDYDVSVKAREYLV